MKYQEGNIVLLNSGETVSIIVIDDKKQSYTVASVDDTEKVWTVKESQINMYLT